MTSPTLITTCFFCGRDYLVKMTVNDISLQLSISDKQSGEEWQCNYDSAFIENQTRKTGNYKQFGVFVSMLKSGLLKTSNSISLDLLTYDDLEQLRTKRSKHSVRSRSPIQSNKRYFIVTYSVEFDRIHYPLPLEYTGPPNPAVLQSTIRKLQTSLEDLQKSSNIEIESLKARVEELTSENFQLHQKIKQLPNTRNITPRSEVETLQNAITGLERNVNIERRSHHKLVDKLQKEKNRLSVELERVKQTENFLRTKLRGKNSPKSIASCNKTSTCSPTRMSAPPESLQTIFRHWKAPSASNTSATNSRFVSPTGKPSSLSQTASQHRCLSCRSRDCSPKTTRSSRTSSNSSERDSKFRYQGNTSASLQKNKQRCVRKRNIGEASRSSSESSYSSCKDNLKLINKHGPRNRKIDMKTLNERIEKLQILLSEKS